MQGNLIRKNILICLSLSTLFIFPALLDAQKRGVEIVRNEAGKRVDISIDGQPFTSYIWAENIKKPVLYPVWTANGTIITRKFPLEPMAGESVDHPHQVGLWFDYSNVNGVDFWNNSTWRKPEELAKMGTIVHQQIIKIVNGKTVGTLQVEADWIMPGGTRILREDTTYIFYAGKSSRKIDRITRLTALDQKVIFNDNKDGLFGLRVRRELEQPTKQPILLTGANGKPSEKPVLNNEGVSGEYRSSEGKTGDDVWGTRGKWTMLSGQVGPEPVTIAILDHPKNVGFPTYWMARGYGLFAANPLGQKDYMTEKKESPVRELKFTLEPKHSVTLRYRVLILSERASPEKIESEYKNFTK